VFLRCVDRAGSMVDGGWIEVKRVAESEDSQVTGNGGGKLWWRWE